jgi:hypothetical protein
MANPNIAELTTIIGQTNGLNLTTSIQSLISNGASTNQIYKVNNLLACNKTDADATVSVTVNINGTNYELVSELTIPGRSTIDIVDGPIYLTENSSISALASANTTVDLLGSFEKIT